MNKEQIDLEIDLGSFDQALRINAVRELKILLDSDRVSIVPELPAANLHCHTFFLLMLTAIHPLLSPGRL